MTDPTDPKKDIHPMATVMAMEQTLFVWEAATTKAQIHLKAFDEHIRAHGKPPLTDDEKMIMERWYRLGYLDGFTGGMKLVNSLDKLGDAITTTEKPTEDVS